VEFDESVEKRWGTERIFQSLDNTRRGYGGVFHGIHPLVRIHSLQVPCIDLVPLTLFISETIVIRYPVAPSHSATFRLTRINNNEQRDSILEIIEKSRNRVGCVKMMKIDGACRSANFRAARRGRACNCAIYDRHSKRTLRVFNKAVFRPLPASRARACARAHICRSR